jgi:hypothetical protein
VGALAARADSHSALFIEHQSRVIQRVRGADSPIGQVSGVSCDAVELFNSVCELVVATRGDNMSSLILALQNGDIDGVRRMLEVSRHCIFLSPSCTCVRLGFCFWV